MKKHLSLSFASSLFAVVCYLVLLGAQTNRLSSPIVLGDLPQAGWHAHELLFWLRARALP